MPGGPLAHVGILVGDLDAALDTWRRILAAVDPEHVMEPLVRVDGVRIGGDHLRWAGFPASSGAEVQLLQPLNDGPLMRALRMRGEGLHHVCFTPRDLEGAVEALQGSGIRLLGDAPQPDPAIPWQSWAFISPRSTHGALVELIRPYRSVGGRWQPD